MFISLTVVEDLVCDWSAHFLGGLQGGTKITGAARLLCKTTDLTRSQETKRVKKVHGSRNFLETAN